MTPLEIRADMDVATICATCEKTLLNVHATELAGVIGHHRDDFDLIWLADGSAVLNTRVWQEMVPPFRHSVVVVNLSFENGRVSDIGAIEKHQFGT
ncbi:hypothetical protein PE067_00050 [Paracoccus sp. DMF-8]|uniref:hypothetical protein n=1 Tax=Paracoccus sp. DMF-8 TaxID=3019445 RepID=UPI0023E7B89F|nr:hypothetical protein [Paracoccus sp. DMF-8]MDF3604688.1 hypothetical protein [Paracoccus sp. DMF-8]